MEHQEIFEASKKRFIEHLIKKYPKINEFKKGEHTNELTIRIPLDYLKTLLFYYRLFVENSKAPIIRKLPFKKLKKIQETLESLKRGGWLIGTNVEEILSYINEKIFNTPKGDKYKLEKIKSRYINKGGPWEDFPLNFLIFFLVSYIKEEWGRPNYRLLANFLVEQEIFSIRDSEKTNVELLKKRYVRTKLNKLWIYYIEVVVVTEEDYFRELFSYNDIPQDQRVDFQNACLPEFVDFFHPNWRERNNIPSKNHI